MSVNRYSVGVDGIDPNGNLVKYEDYAALEQKLAESQREFRAADATIENLQMQVENLAAENAGLKKVLATDSETMLLALDAFNTHGSTRPDVGLQQAINVVMQRRETPDTDAFLAEIRASAIKDALKSLDGVFDNDCVMESNGISYEDAEQRTAGAYAVSKALDEFATQLRKGVQS